MNGYLLDTHVWLWIVQQATDEVSTGFFKEVEEWQRKARIFLSPISGWEVGLLVAHGQITLDTSVEEVWNRSTESDRVQSLPLSARILIESTRLPGDLHRDPSDRILAASAREHELTLVTRDKRLLDYAKQGHLKARKP